MPTRVLITGAGGGGSNNLIRDLRTVDTETVVIGSQMDRYLAAKSLADRTYLLPVATEADAYVDAMNRLIEKESIDLVVPNSDREVATVSARRDDLNCRVFLPSDASVRACQDKLAFARTMTAGGIPVARTAHVPSIADVEQVWEEHFAGADMLWIRPRSGSGSKGATKVQNPRQTAAWIEYWRDVRGYSEDVFLLHEYLPGRDCAVQSTWVDGKVQIMKTLERVSYYGGEARPSGQSSTPQVARTFRDDSVLDTCLRSAAVLDGADGSPGAPHGNWNFDLKQDADGRWCLTEINIGRFCQITPGFDLTGRHNMIEAYIRLGMGERPDYGDPIDIEEDMYLLRFLDTEPLVLSADELERSATTV